MQKGEKIERKKSEGAQDVRRKEKKKECRQKRGKEKQNEFR